MNKQVGNILYFSHGGGPMPILNDPSHDKMIAFMKAIPKRITKPQAIVLISAHWEAEIITVQSGLKPQLLYDYYGFPKETYQLQYPCAGHPQLAKKIINLLSDRQIPVQSDVHRPYDHGAYIPLMLMYPEADIPVVQISLHHNLSPQAHLALGEALKPLLEEPILIIGSGFSFHNMREFGHSGPDLKNDAFQEALIALLSAPEHPIDSAAYPANCSTFAQWDQLPFARYCHPREEHLLPLHVCVGASNNFATLVFDDFIIDKRSVAFLW